jgi:Tfp pilus assembly protein PilO
MKTGRQTLLAVVTAAVILGTGILTLVIEPRRQEHKARMVQLHDLQVKLAKLQADLLVRNRIDEMYKQIEPLIKNTGNDQQEISAFTRELSDLYSKLNVKMRSVKLLPTVREEFYRLLSVKIEMQGHIRDIVRFVLLIEAHASPLRIEQFGVKARETTDEVHASFLVTKVVAESGS